MKEYRFEEAAPPTERQKKHDYFCISSSDLTELVVRPYREQTRDLPRKMAAAIVFIDRGRCWTLPTPLLSHSHVANANKVSYEILFIADARLDIVDIFIICEICVSCREFTIAICNNEAQFVCEIPGYCRKFSIASERLNPAS